MTYDVVIVGGGPAGVTAGVSLRQQTPLATIALFHANTNDRWRPGEILAPGAAQILRSLGCWPVFLEKRFLESYGTRAAWGSSELHDNEFLFGLRGNGWRVDRAQFDAMLLHHARSLDIEVHDNMPLLESKRDQEHWRLKFRDRECHARFVIDASGRSAVFGVQRGARRLPDDKLAGAVVFFDSANAGETLIEAVESGWWYSASIPNSTTVVAFMTDVDLIRDGQLHTAERWNELLTRSTHTRERARGAIPKALPAIITANSQRLGDMCGAGWVAAGDAAMTFDPLSSQGILKALRSGKLASFVAADFLRGIDSHEKYGKLAIAEYSEYKKAKAIYYGMEKRWPEAIFWNRRRSFTSA